MNYFDNYYLEITSLFYCNYILIFVLLLLYTIEKYKCVLV